MRFYITRYSPSGSIECEDEYMKNAYQPFDLSIPLKFAYLSHCGRVKIRQNENSFDFISRLDIAFSNVNSQQISTYSFNEDDYKNPQKDWCAFL